MADLPSLNVAPALVLPPSTISNDATSPTSQAASVPTASVESPSEATAPSRKKFGSPFAWLSRNPSNNDKKLKSPPAAPRKSASGSLPFWSTDSIASRIEEEGAHTNVNGRLGNVNSLKDRFAMVRMREEAGNAIADSAEPSASPTGERSRAGSVFSNTEADPAVVTALQRRTSDVLNATHRPSVSDTLAPGTAAGTSAPAEAENESHVNWDLWQAVVYEGPAAVSRTSPDELSRAIANGIPSAIRGVVWQVLALSKSDELEAVYRDLVSRGSDPEKIMTDAKHNPSISTARPSTPGANGDLEKVASSASSFHSTDSRPTSPNGHVLDSAISHQSIPGTEDAKPAPLEPKRTAKDEAANLVKLEKVIKRDLGARTSFSKFLMSAGLQNGLFGICKAYALFDEEVGYAQGMNFIAMPLLFNVSPSKSTLPAVLTHDHRCQKKRPFAYLYD